MEILIIALKIPAMMVFTILSQVLIGEALKPRPRLDRTDLTVAAVCCLSAGIIMLKADMHPAESLLWGTVITSLFILLPAIFGGLLRPIIQWRDEWLRSVVEGRTKRP